METIITIKDLRKVYKLGSEKVVALDNINLEIQKGQVCCILGLVLSVGVISGTRIVSFMGMDAGLSIWFLVGLGLANSLIYAGIWPLAIRNLGRFTKTGSSMLVMALFGNAVTPLLYGAIVDHATPRIAYLCILVPGFLYLTWYSLHGYKITSWTKRQRI